MALKQCIFIDANGRELIIEHRKSAVFFKRITDLTVTNKYAYPSNPRKDVHSAYICESELRRVYTFTDQQFDELYLYCEDIANEAWKQFEPKPIDSFGAEYDGYYDKEFDNNGSLRLRKNTIDVEGPYTQLKEKGSIVRLVQFNKRKFESFVYDLKTLINQHPEK